MLAAKMKKQKRGRQESLDTEAMRGKIARRAHRRSRFLLFHVFIFSGWVVIFLLALIEHLLNPGVRTDYVRWHEPEMAMLLMIAMMGFHYIWARIGKAEDRALLEILGDTGEKRMLRREEKNLKQVPRFTESHRFQLGDDEFITDELTESKNAYYEQISIQNNIP